MGLSRLITDCIRGNDAIIGEEGGVSGPTLAHICAALCSDHDGPCSVPCADVLHLARPPRPSSARSTCRRPDPAPCSRPLIGCGPPSTCSRCSLACLSSLSVWCVLSPAFLSLTGCKACPRPSRVSAHASTLSRSQAYVLVRFPPRGCSLEARGCRPWYVCHVQSTHHVVSPQNIFC